MRLWRKTIRPCHAANLNRLLAVRQMLFRLKNINQNNLTTAWDERGSRLTKRNGSWEQSRSRLKEGETHLMRSRYLAAPIC